MRETFGNVLFFTTYETTRYHLFTSFGLDPNRAKSSQTDEAVSTQSMVANTLLETGIGIVTGGLAGVAVSARDHTLISRISRSSSSFLNVYNTTIHDHRTIVILKMIC